MNLGEVVTEVTRQVAVGKSLNLHPELVLMSHKQKFELAYGFVSVMGLSVKEGPNVEGIKVLFSLSGANR